METMEMHVAVSSHSGTFFLDDWTRLRLQGWPPQPPEASPGLPDTVIERRGVALHLHKAAPCLHSPPHLLNQGHKVEGWRRGEGESRDLARVQGEVTLASGRAVAPGKEKRQGQDRATGWGHSGPGASWGPGLGRD